MANTASTTAKHMAEMVMAKRAEEFRRREKMLRDIVADYFDATEQAQKTRAAAQTRADKIRAQVDERIAALRDQAEDTADEHERRASFAISQMLALGENPKAIADTLNIPITRVREIQRLTPAPSGATRRTK